MHNLTAVTILEYWITECVRTFISSTTVTTAKPTATASPQTNIVWGKPVPAEDGTIFYLIVACTAIVGAATVCFLILCVACICKQHFNSCYTTSDIENEQEKSEFIREYSFTIIMYLFLLV